MFRLQYKEELYMNKKTPNQLLENTPGQRIRKLRLTAGLTQEQLSELLGFTANYLGQVERDAVGLSKNLADALCDYFNVTYNYLYCQSDSWNTAMEHGLTGPGQTPIIALIKNCSEDECRLLEPVARACIQALRKARRLDRQNTRQ